jgi:pimeloyl-ACP methyl ester carboxylesterase/DNA-binding CsgD family transcriptional regulator
MPTSKMLSGPDGTTTTVIEALYDLPSNGSWIDLQQALCAYWSNVGTQPITSEIGLLERHFERALALMERLHTHENAWRDELYRVPLAAAIFNARGELIDANTGGRRALGCESEALASLPASDQARVCNAIAKLRSQSLIAMAIRGFKQLEMRLYISELPRGFEPDRPLYLGVLVSKQLPEEGELLLKNLFELTPREAQLCMQLASGASLDAIARTSDVKKTTLRTHLANCFAKLEVNSQPELVSLVLQSVFAGMQLDREKPGAPALTAHLLPELHGHPKFRTVELRDGRRLGYFEYGDRGGIPVIYLHGSMDCGLIMKTQHLEGRGVRLIAAERGGVGESSPPRDPRPSAYADDLMQLADALSLNAYAVVGRSMGSWDAIELCLADRARVRLLALASGRLPVERSDQHDAHPPFFRALYNAVWRSPTMGRLMLRTMQLQLLMKGPKHFLPEDGLPAIELELVRDEDYQRHMKAIWLRCALTGTDSTNAHLNLYRDPVENPPWKGLATPTLLIHGDADAVVPPDLVLKQTETFRDRKVVLLPGVGHRLVHVAMGQVLSIVRRAWEDGEDATDPPVPSD